MKKPFFLFAVLLIVFAGLALATQEPKKPAGKISKDQCLACHGPFEKLINGKAKYTAPGDQVVNPHKYVPHDSEDVPECTECHIAHEIPLQDKSTVQKPKDVQFCYDSCHHMKNLQPCKTCH